MSYMKFTAARILCVIKVHFIRRGKNLSCLIQSHYHGNENLSCVLHNIQGRRHQYGWYGHGHTGFQVEYGFAGILTFKHVATSSVFPLVFFEASGAQSHDERTDFLCVFTSLGFKLCRYSGARDEINMRGINRSEWWQPQQNVHNTTFLPTHITFPHREFIRTVRQSQKPESSD